MCSRDSVIINSTSDSSHVSDDIFAHASGQNQSKMESQVQNATYSRSLSERSISMSDEPLEIFKSISVDHVSESSESDYSESFFTKISTPLVRENSRKLHLNLDTSLIPQISKSLHTSVAESDRSDVSILEDSFNYSGEASEIPDVTCNLKKTLAKSWLNNVPLTPAKAPKNESWHINKQGNANTLLNLKCGLPKNIKIVEEEEKVEITNEDSSCSKSLSLISNRSNIDRNSQEILKDRPYNLRKPKKTGKENKISNEFEFSKLIPKILITPMTENKTRITENLSNINSVDKKASNIKSHRSKKRATKIVSSLDFGNDISKIMDSVMSLKMSSDEEGDEIHKSARKILQSEHPEERALNLADSNLFTPRRKLYFRNPSDDFIAEDKVKNVESPFSSNNNPVYFTPHIKSRLRGLGALLNESLQNKKDIKGSGNIISDEFNDNKSPTKDWEGKSFDQYPLDDIVNRLSDKNSQNEVVIPRCPISDTSKEKSIEKETQGNCSFDVSYLLNECNTKTNVNDSLKLIYDECRLSTDRSMSNTNCSLTQSNVCNTPLTNDSSNRMNLVQESINNGTLYQSNNTSFQSIPKKSQDKLICFSGAVQKKNKDLACFENLSELKKIVYVSDSDITNENGSEFFLNSFNSGLDNTVHDSSNVLTDFLSASSSNKGAHLQMNSNTLDYTAEVDESPFSITKNVCNEELKNSDDIVQCPRICSGIYFKISQTSPEKFTSKIRKEELDSGTEIVEVVDNIGSHAYEEGTVPNGCIETGDTDCKIVQHNSFNNEITQRVSHALSDSDDSFNGILRSKTPLKKNYLNVSDGDIVNHSTLDKNFFDDWEKPLCPIKKTCNDKYDPNMLILRDHEFSSSSDIEINEYGPDDVVEVSSESSEAEELNDDYSGELVSRLCIKNSEFDNSFVQLKRHQLSNVKIPSHSSSPFHTSFLLSLTEEIPPEMCHPDAVKYRDSFQKNKNILVDLLFTLYNQEVFNSKLPPLEIKWSGRLTTTSGITKSSSRITSTGKVRTSGIKLSKTIVDTAAKLRDVLLHEMCHAANWLIDERSGGHGPLFRKWADKARFRFPEIPKVSVCHRYELKWKYIYKCTFCGYEVGKMKLSLKDYACGLCGGRVAVV